MQICRVKGNVWATRKEETLKGQKFLIVTRIDENQSEIGPPFVAVDNILLQRAVQLEMHPMNHCRCMNLWWL